MVKIKINYDDSTSSVAEYSENSCIKIRLGFNKYRTIEGIFSEDQNGKMKFFPSIGDRGQYSEIHLHGREFDVEMVDGVVVGIYKPTYNGSRDGTRQLMEIYECEEIYGDGDTSLGQGTASSEESKHPAAPAAATATDPEPWWAMGGKRRGGGRKKKKLKKQAKTKSKKAKKQKSEISISLRKQIKRELKKRGIEYGKSASLLSTQSPIDIVINDFNGNVDEYINSLVKPEIKSDMDLVLEALEDSDSDNEYKGGKRRQRKKRTKKKSRRKKRKTVRKKRKRRRKKRKLK